MKITNLRESLRPYFKMITSVSTTHVVTRFLLQFFIEIVDMKPSAPNLVRKFERETDLMDSS